MLRPPSLLALTALIGLSGCGAQPAAQPDPPTAAGPPQAAVQAYTEATRLSQAGRLPEAAARFDEAASLDPESAQVWLAAARSRATLHESDAAAVRAREALKRAPDDADVVTDAAVIIAEGGAVDEARKLLQDLAAKRPEDARPMVRLAGLALDRGELEEAEEALKQATRRNPNHAEAWEKLGQVKARQGRTAQAAAAFERCVTLDARRAGLVPLILRMAIDGGDLDVARRALQRMGGDKTTEAQAGVLLAGMLQERGDPLSAVSELERAVKLEPGNVVARLRLASLLAESERWADADLMLAGVPAGTDHTANARRLRAYVAAEQGKLDLAWDLLEEARAAGADTPEVASQQARIRRKQGRFGDARTVVEASRKRFTDDPGLAYLEAMIVQDLGDEAGALERMERVVERFPKHAGALNFVGFSWAEKGVRLPEAETYVRRAMEAAPDDGAIIDSLGWVLFKRGDFEGARKQLLRAIELMPGEGELHYHLGEVLLALGDRPAARAALEKAVALEVGESSTSVASRKRWQRRLAAVRKGKK